KQLNTFYNETFQNSMTFAYNYLDDCSKQEIGVPDALATEVETKLKDLKSALKTIDSATSQLADVVKFAKISSHDAEGYEFDSSCLYELRNVFEKYETLLTASLNFNNALARIYFGYALRNVNVDYSKYYIDGSEYDLNFKNANIISSAIGYLTPKVKFQIVNLTQCMFELNIKASDLPNQFTTSPYATPGKFYGDYQDNIKEINKKLETTKTEIIMADDEKVTALLNNLVRLYNVQSSITNDMEMYLTAFATIQYLKVENDIINATLTEKMCLDIIKNYDAIIQDYQEVLADLVDFIVKL
ncbi:MAG: hypothetical protein MJ152_00625, partial [Clostridia bacterium]|nr:hypothetical protein [Clostridia bacterium]